METLAKLLERRALCLRSMLEMTVSCLDELRSRGDDGLAAFHTRRKGVFEVIRSLDARIEPLMAGADPAATTVLLEEQAGYLAQLRAVDAQVYMEIDRIKSEVVYNLHQLNSGRRVISAYKSPESRLENAQGAGQVNKEA